MKKDKEEKYEIETKYDDSKRCCNSIGGFDWYSI